MQFHKRDDSEIKIKPRWTIADFSTHFWKSLYNLTDGFTVLTFKNTHPQITALLLELFWAQQDVHKAKLAKCNSTVPHYNLRCCTEIQYSYLFGCDTSVNFHCGCGARLCARVHVQSDSLKFMGDERGS